MKTLTKEQAEALYAFVQCFELYTTGVWPVIEEHMREDFGIEDPDDALEEAMDVLRG